MLGHLRPTLTRCVLVSFAVLALPALAQAASGGFAPPRVIMAPRFVPRPAVRAPLRSQSFLRRDELREHRFFRRRGTLGLDGGAYPYPVPVPGGGSAQPPADGSPPPDAYPGGYGGGYRAPSQTSSGPQILVLPDPPAGRRGAGRPAGGYRPEPSATRSADRGAPLAPRPSARRWHERPSYAAAAPRRIYWPSYAYVPSRLAPCSEDAYAPIYNTPCGLRPYE
jgi:hypothetical protein